MQVSFPKPGRALIGLLVANVVCYVLQLLLLRANQTWVTELYLRPSSVFEGGKLWQPFTYFWLHDPTRTFHLLGNMLWLWMFGTRLEHWWGLRRFLTAYGVFALGGAALTLIIGLLSRTSVLGPLLPHFWTSPHLGASGAVVGMTVAYGLTFANEEMNLLFLGRMKAKTFVLIILAIELLVALSYEPTSSTSHFGGMIAAYILCRGLWRPSKWKDMARRADLQRKKKKIEAELKVIQGGKSNGGGDGNPSDWN
jgi:rhomboid-like protein